MSDLVPIEESPLSLPENVLKKLENYEDFLSYYIYLEQTTTAVSWLKADLLKELSNRQGDKALEMIANDIKQPRSTVINYVRTAKAFPPEKRIEDVSFSVHFQASFADSYDDIKGEFTTENRFEWVQKAADEGLSTRKLAEAIKKDKRTEGGSKPVVCQFCGKVEGDVFHYAFYQIGKKGKDEWDFHEECYEEVKVFILTGKNGKKEAN